MYAGGDKQGYSKYTLEDPIGPSSSYQHQAQSLGIESSLCSYTNKKKKYAVHATGPQCHTL